MQVQSIITIRVINESGTPNCQYKMMRPGASKPTSGDLLGARATRGVEVDTLAEFHVSEEGVERHEEWEAHLVPCGCLII